MSPQEGGWLELVRCGRGLKLTILLGGVLLYAMNALLTSTVAPSAVREFGGIVYITWPTAAFLSSSIAAASAAGLLTSRIGARYAYSLAASVFLLGALWCAVAAGMPQLIAGRFVQGIGGGLISSLSYVLVRMMFPERLWPRAFALISAVWGIAVLLGPLIGGAFSNAGSWRGAFYFVASAAALLALAAVIGLPSEEVPARRSEGDSFPIGRLTLLTVSIAAMCAAQVAQGAAIVLALITLSVAAVAIMLRLDRSARDPLFPSDAFSVRSVVGCGLWMALLLSIAGDAFPLYGPLFLQEIYHLNPLSAGYMVALEALSWTLAAVTVAGWGELWSSRLVVAGPLVMGAGLVGISFLMSAGTLAQLPPAIICAGAGIGCCWAFIAQRVMQAAKPGEGDLAASSIPTVQLFGFALGGAVAGLIADLAGYSNGLTLQATHTAARFLPSTFAIATIAAAIAGGRMISASAAALLRARG
jgi:MFS family permease